MHNRLFRKFSKELLKSRYDVTILGGGITGLSLAWKLASHEYFAEGHSRKMLVIDRRNLFNEDFSKPSNRVFSMTHQSLAFFDKLDFSKVSNAMIHFIDGMQIWSHGSDTFLRFDKRHCPPDWPHFGAIVNQNYVLSKLFSQIRDQSVDFLFTEDSVKHIDNASQREAQITLSNGDDIKSKLLVSAEAGQSDISKLVGVGSIGTNHNQKAVTCSLRSADFHQNICFQKYFAEEVIGILPTGANTWSIVWSVRNDYHDYLLNLPSADFLRELNSKLGTQNTRSGFSAPPFFIEKIDKIASFPLQSLLLDSLVLGNVVFIGDSAHKIHPMLGQGLNLGITDAIELSRQLHWMLDNCIDLKRTNFLNDWSHKMQYNNFFFQSAVEFLKASYYTRNPAVRLARDTAIEVINSSNVIKQQFVKLAN